LRSAHAKGSRVAQEQDTELERGGIKGAAGRRQAQRHGHAR